MNFGSEARHRQTGDEELHDELLVGNKERKHRKRNEHVCSERVSPGASLLITTLLFTSAALLMLSSSFTRRIALEAPRIRLGHQERIRVQESQTKPVPRSDDRLLEWLQASEEIQLLKMRNNGALKIGLVDIPKPNVVSWKAVAGGEKPTVFSSVLKGEKKSWSDFFPEDINRDEAVQNARCPDMPLPNVQDRLKLDLVVVNLVFDPEAGPRDITRLQSSRAAAHVASQTGSKYVVVASSSRPEPNIFKCKELVEREKGIWLYQLNYDRIIKLLSLPVGSCKAVQVSPESRADERDTSREAYATIIHSVKSYVCGAVVLAQSIRRTGSTRDLILLADAHIKPEEKQGLEEGGWRVETIERIRNPKAKHLAYNEWNYSKFRLWQLTRYDKVVFIDADVVVTRNMDFLFSYPELSAARNHGTVFNSGVMVIEPSNCTFEYLMEGMRRIESYNGGDQGYLNEVFTGWHRLPRAMNFLKHFDDDTEENERKVAMLTAEPAVVYAMHFLGTKPWTCGRERECNRKRDFASQAVHERWWRLHDTMPPRLHELCSIKKEKDTL